MELVLAFIGGTILPAIATGVRWWTVRKDKKEAQALPSALNKVHQVYGIITQLQQDLGADRVMIGVVSNGGSIPNVNSPLYVTMLYATGGDDFLRTWARQQIDQSIMEVLRHLLATDVFEHHIKDMKPGYVRHSLEAGDLKTNWSANIVSKPGKMYNIGLNFKEERLATGAELETMRAAINSLKVFFK